MWLWSLIVVVFNIGQEITVVVLVTAGYETERRFGYKSKHYILNIMQNFFQQPSILRATCYEQHFHISKHDPRLAIARSKVLRKALQGGVHEKKEERIEATKMRKFIKGTGKRHCVYSRGSWVLSQEF